MVKSLSFSASESEQRTRDMTKEEFTNRWWEMGNPSRNEGQVYQECEFRNGNDDTLKSLKHNRPDFLAVISHNTSEPFYMVVECKSSKRNIQAAIEQAKDYCAIINKAKNDSALFALGIAGTDPKNNQSALCKFDGRKWVEIKRGLLKDCLPTEDELSEIAKGINRKTQPAELTTQIIDKINTTLYKAGVPESQRPSLVSTLLLCLAKDPDITPTNNDENFIKQININAEAEWREINNSPHRISNYLQLTEHHNTNQQRKYANVCKDIIRILRENNVVKALSSNPEKLGMLVETSFKYGNSLKDAGAVFTPPHITQFAAEVVDIQPNHTVFDPTCGVGSFLSAATDKSNKRGVKLYGVETIDVLYGIAKTSLAMLGCGVEGIKSGDCFDYSCSDLCGEKEGFDRVLMNPPFSQQVPETDFVDYALRQTKPRGLVFAILPVGHLRGPKSRVWRENLLKSHSVLACVRLDKNLFYPNAQVATSALIIRARVPHFPQSKVFWGCMSDDNHRPQLSKMVSKHDTKDNVAEITKHLKNHILGLNTGVSVPREMEVCPLNTTRHCDFAPEMHILSGPTQCKNVGFRKISAQVQSWKNTLSNTPMKEPQNIKTFRVLDVVQSEVKALFRGNIKDFKTGNVPLVSACAIDNGIGAYLQIPPDLCTSHCITINSTHNTKPCEAFWHPYTFAAKLGTGFVLKPTEEMINNPDSIYYLCEAITQKNAWRYNWHNTPQLEDLYVDLPATPEGNPDVEAMGRVLSELS